VWIVVSKFADYIKEKTIHETLEEALQEVGTRNRESNIYQHYVLEVPEMPVDKELLDLFKAR
jgi:hypothetical protein